MVTFTPGNHLTGGCADLRANPLGCGVSVLARRVMAKCVLFTVRTFLMNAHEFAVVVFKEAQSEKTSLGSFRSNDAKL